MRQGRIITLAAIVATVAIAGCGSSSSHTSTTPDIVQVQATYAKQHPAPAPPPPSKLEQQLLNDTNSGNEQAATTLCLAHPSLDGCNGL